MKKIILSASAIVAVGAMLVGGTIAYFSDTETSTGNTFTAGTIDISVNDQNPWTETFHLEDMKPCYTDYINFRIDNDGSNPNPVDIYKLIANITEDTGTVSEPECTEQAGGTWDPGTKTCTWDPIDSDNNNLSGWIWYDLFVEVYDASGNLIWWQTIYVDADGKSIDDIYGSGQIYLGMIPAGGYMLVEQSYHLSPLTENWAQGDIMTFDIQVKGEQIKGTTVLEDKSGAPDWKLVLDNDIKGTLTYEVKNPKFKFDFNGKVKTPGDYVLAAGMKPAGGNNYDVDTYLGEGTADGGGIISFNGDIELNKDMKDMKVWLMPKATWNSGNITWVNMDDFLWETGLIWYDDTDL